MLQAECFMSFILLQGPPGSSRASPGVQTRVPAGEQSQPCYSPAPWEQSKGQTWAPWPQSKEPRLNPLSSQDEGEAPMRLLPPPQHPLPQQQQPWAQLYHVRTCINPPLAPGWGIYSLQDGFRLAGRESSSAMAGCTSFVGSRGGHPVCKERQEPPKVFQPWGAAWHGQGQHRACLAAGGQELPGKMS